MKTFTVTIQDQHACLYHYADSYVALIKSYKIILDLLLDNDIFQKLAQLERYHLFEYSTLEFVFHIFSWSDILVHSLIFHLKMPDV